MTDDISNNNAVLPVREPDAHGQAVEIVDVATEVKSKIGPELGDTPETLQKSIYLLQAISASLGLDIPKK